MNNRGINGWIHTPQPCVAPLISFPPESQDEVGRLSMRGQIRLFNDYRTAEGQKTGRTQVSGVG